MSICRHVEMLLAYMKVRFGVRRMSEKEDPIVCLKNDDLNCRLEEAADRTMRRGTNKVEHCCWELLSITLSEMVGSCIFFF